jgi:hypothetical protein
LLPLIAKQIRLQRLLLVIMQRLKPLTLHSADKLLSEGFGRSGNFPNIG